MRSTIVLLLAVVPACAFEPECTFAPPLSGGPGEAGEPVVGVIETWTADTITVRTTDDWPQELSVTLPATTVDVGAADAVGSAVLVEVFHNMIDNFECGDRCFNDMLNARITTESGTLIFKADPYSWTTQPIDDAPLCINSHGDRVQPGESTVASDEGETVFRSGDEHVLTFSGQRYVVQDIASYVEGESTLSTAMFAHRAIFPLATP